MVAEGDASNDVARRRAHMPEGTGAILDTRSLATTRRADPDFETRAGIWAAVAATRGHQMVADGVISEAERCAAEADYRAWLRDGAQTHVQYLRAVEGVRA